MPIINLIGWKFKSVGIGIVFKFEYETEIEENEEKKRLQWLADIVCLGDAGDNSW